MNLRHKILALLFFVLYKVLKYPFLKKKILKSSKALALKIAIKKAKKLQKLWGENLKDKRLKGQKADDAKRVYEKR